MKEPFKYGSCLLSLTPIWVALPSDSEISISIKPLTHSIISSMQEVNYLLEHNNSFFNPKTFRTIVSDAIVSTNNILNFPDIKTVGSQLHKEDITFLYKCLIDISVVTGKQLDALNTIIDIQFNEQFSDESWDCTICQERKLDYSRACGFLPKNKRDPSPFLPKVNGKRFSECPVSTIDTYAISQASMAYSFLNSGILPEAGGVGNQTEWFVRASILYKRKYDEATKAALERN